MDSRPQVGASPVPPQYVLPALLPLSAPIHREPALVVTLTHAEVYPLAVLSLYRCGPRSSLTMSSASSASC